MKQVLLEFPFVETAAYALRSSLGKVLYGTVQNINDNIDETWNKLDEKINKTSVLADVIMNQIKKF